MSDQRPARRTPRFPPPPEAENPAALSRLALEAAARHGFVAAGIFAADRPRSWEVFRSWLSEGLHGEMTWLERDSEPRTAFDSVLPYCRSVLAVARAVPGGGPGNVARYARGEDYHAAVRRQLKRVATELREAAPPGTHFRVAVDTAPVLEREAALRAGLGFIGKNAMLIVPGVGSHVVLGELLTDVALAPTAATIDDSLDACGTCVLCVDACPTRALIGNRRLDARLCLSYLTIEKRSPFTLEEEEALDGRIFGCDDCQDVCPWNVPAPPPPAGGVPASLDVAEVAALDGEAFRRRFSPTALARATHEGLVRNARAALRLTNARTAP